MACHPKLASPSFVKKEDGLPSDKKHKELYRRYFYRNYTGN